MLPYICIRINRTTLLSPASGKDGSCSHKGHVMENPDRLIRVIKRLITTSLKVCGPILQIFLSIDNRTVAFDAYKVRMNDFIVFFNILVEKVLNKLPVQCAQPGAVRKRMV